MIYDTFPRENSDNPLQYVVVMGDMMVVGDITGTPANLSGLPPKLSAKVSGVPAIISGHIPGAQPTKSIISGIRIFVPYDVLGTAVDIKGKQTTTNTEARRLFSG